MTNQKTAKRSYLNLIGGIKKLQILILTHLP